MVLKQQYYRTAKMRLSLPCLLYTSDFAVACMRANLRYEKNQRREDVKSHHYIISFDPRDGPDNGLTVDLSLIHILNGKYVWDIS